MTERNEKVCPRCGQTYTEPPAVSRNGLGDICPRCGMVEALEAAGFNNPEQKVDEMLHTVQHGDFS